METTCTHEAETGCVTCGESVYATRQHTNIRMHNEVQSIIISVLIIKE